MTEPTALQAPPENPDGLDLDFLQDDLDDLRVQLRDLKLHSDILNEAIQNQAQGIANLAGIIQQLSIIVEAHHRHLFGHPVESHPTAIEPEDQAEGEPRV